MQPSGESPSKWVSPIACTGEGGNPTAFQCPEQTLWGVSILPVSSKKGMQAKTPLGQLYLHQREQTKHKQSPDMLYTLSAMIPAKEGMQVQL